MDGRNLNPKRILGVIEAICSYHRKYCKNFAAIARPLHKLTEANQLFIWTVKRQNAFERLEQTLISAPFLGYPNAKDLFILNVMQVKQP